MRIARTLFKISPKKSDGGIFWKKQENPNFGPLCRNINLPLRLTCISFCRLKILSHIQKKFEMPNVGILRKIVNRQTYGQIIHL